MTDDAPPTYRARDLLHLMLEYGSISPQTTWQVSDRPDEPVWHVRFQRITSLVRALGLGNDASEVVSGRFLEGADEHYYEQALVRFANTYPDKYRGFRRGSQPRRGSYGEGASRTFRLLYEARVRYYEAQRLGSSILMTSDPMFGCGYRALRQLEAQIQPTLEPFEAILCFMMDPKQRSFTEAELVADYEWTTDDLPHIDHAFI